MRVTRALRHVAVLGAVSATVLAAYHFAASAASTVASVSDEPGTPGMSDVFRQMAALGSGYDLSSLKNLRRADALIDQQYVDPVRVDHAGMFEAALDFVEREVPGVLLRVEGEGQRLHVAVGNYSTVLTLEKIDGFTELEDQLKRVAAILEEHLDDPDVKPEFIEYAMINGVLSTLDPHSVFLPPENSKKMEEDNEGEFGGLGITIKIEDGGLTVDYPLEDTPAHRAGLIAGDRIVKIEGEGTLNMDLEEAVSKMRGPPGSGVTITVDREGFAQPKDFTIVREMIKPSRVWGALLDGNVGYVRIDQFHSQVETQLEESLAKLYRDAGPNGLRGLVLDMRDNPGGFLHQAVGVADKFLQTGTIVSTVERNNRNRESKDARDTGTELGNIPVAVLMSGNSASASEIVAGALRNTERAIIVGERSFGKGSVQNLYPFNDGSRLKLTVARYLTPGDHSIQSVGIPPDIELERAYVKPPKEVEYESGGQKLKETSGPRISLFARDNLQREADLDGHLQSSEEIGGKPVYSLRYYFDPDENAQRTDRKDPRKDFEVMLARDVLVATQGSRRPDVLRDAATVVAQRSKVESGKIEQAFKADGVAIDWSACTNPDQADIRTELKIGDDGVLDAGKMETVSLAVTNLGTKPLCQVVALAESGNDALDDQEFYLGKIPAGETRTYSTKIRLADGYPTEESAVGLKLVDATRRELAQTRVAVRSRGVELPRYAWSWSFSDKGGGDGDGAIEVGETIQMKVDVLNVGPGPGGVGEFMLKKAAGLGRAVELVKGNFSVPTLAPGARASDTLSFKVVQPPAEGKLDFELRVQDSERYDYASIVKAQFYGYYRQSEEIAVPIGEVGPAGRREPPKVTVSKAPDLATGDAQVTISGVATDDTGIHDVILYNGTQKIAYAGGGDGTPLTSVPFTATAELAEGNNLLVVLVRDVNNLTTTHTIDVYRPPKDGDVKIASPSKGDSTKERLEADTPGPN